LVSFFEVVTFFGVAAFFAWLEFLALLNDFATRLISQPVYQHDWEVQQQLRNNLVQISDYFLVSFLFSATAIVADYFYHYPVQLGSYVFGDLVRSLWVLSIVVISFLAGIITLCVPIGYVRSIVRGDRDLLAKPLPVSGTLGLCYLIAVMLGLDWLGYTTIQFYYGNIVAVGAGFLTLVGIKYRKSRLGLPLVLAPLWSWITISAYLYLVHP
jgi:hypothetical protein